MTTSESQPKQPSSLRDKVLEWLRTEGYPLEFRTAKVCRDAGFAVHQGTYTRLDGQTPREIDVMADLDHQVDGTLLRIRHIIECKWTRDHPWVVLSSEHARIAPAACIAQTLGNDIGTAVMWCLAGDKNIHSLGVFAAPERPGFGGREALTKGKDTFYGAAQAVISATKADLDSHNNSNTQDQLKYAEIGLPLVVLDGALFEAYLDHTAGDMTVDQRGSIRLHWDGADAWNFRASIDIVTIDELPTFLAIRRREAETLLIRASEVIAQFKECIRANSLDPLSIIPASRGIVGLPPLLRRMVASFAKKQLPSTSSP